MSLESTPLPAGARASRRAPLLAAGLIVIAALMAYANSFQAPFVFDDERAILANATIRQLWPLTVPLSPPPDAGGVIARPLVNLSLALNYAVGKTSVRGYHLFNVGLHAASALVLFGIIRRTLLRSAGAENAPWLALAIALLWTVHPLQTESVTCIIQRTELLVGFFYLLTLYLFIRGAESPQPARWFAGATLSCLAGMASKEVMVTAPVLILLYDRTFAAGSFREAWRRRKGLHLALASTWLLLAWLVAGSPDRSGVAGFGAGISVWENLLTQCRALVLYLKLSLWPHPLVVDYGTGVVKTATEVLLPGMLVLLLLGGTCFALWRRPVLGFLGAVFFLILAPSSSFVPLASQTIAEHRMYLPLAAVLALLVAGARSLLGMRGVVFALLLVLPATWATVQRNRVYASELSLWSDTVARRPDNPRAHINLGHVLESLKRFPEAIASYEAATRLQPDSPQGYVHLASACFASGQPELALRHASTAVRLDPDDPDARVNLGVVLASLGRAEEALPHYRVALRRQPKASDVHAHLAAALLTLGRLGESVEHARLSLGLQPDRAQTWSDLARALLQQGDLAAAREAGARALTLQPAFPTALSLLGSIESAAKNFAGAIDYQRRALAIAPEYLAARNNLAGALLAAGRVDEAISEYQQVLRERPGDRAAEANLARARTLRR
ncbi:MAG TPA: tetratricopeptide repeat protein [Opitutaceae bacterium]|nr:tetratricopeptide repeat protein [Opitutaceae bacterium]